MGEKLVQVTINRQKITAPASLSAIQALWYGGYTKVDGVSCLEGICGSCRVMVRRANSREVTMQLGCQTFIEEGMQILFISLPTAKCHPYELTDIRNSWVIQDVLHQVFPETVNCRACSGCTRACPKGIDVEYAIKLINKGKLREAGCLFIDCVMCDLCVTSCPECIAPNHVALFCRRVISYFHTRPSNLINRLEELRRKELRVKID